jgi:integrase
MALTAKKLARLLNTPGKYLDESGLYLQVTKNGASWLFRYEIESPTLKSGAPTKPNGRVGRRERWMGLGPLNTFSLKEARDRAKLKRQLLKDGIDPLEAKATEKKARALVAARNTSFEVAARQYFEEHQKKWRNAKHKAQFLSTLEAYAFPIIGQLPISSIDKVLVLKVLEQKHDDYPNQRLWDAIPETANRLRGRIELILGWDAVRSDRSNSANPARWKDHLEHVLTARGKIKDQKVKHLPALSYNKVSEFIADLHQSTTAFSIVDGTAAAALEFTILTVARTSETYGAKWDEFELRAVPVTTRDEEGSESTCMGPCWIVPGERMKSGKRHRVPLTDRTLEILRGCPRQKDNPFVFIGENQGCGLGGMAMLDVLKKRMGLNVTVHGFRSTFRDWAAESSNHPREVIEKALAHGIKDKSEASYWRSDLYDKRRKLMNDWARYCALPKRDASVVPIRKAGG